jgi:hypothetical protein
MRIILDTNILLNDFFYRHPDFGFKRIQNEEQAKEVDAYRQVVHESLLFLSLQQDVQILSSTAIVSRFAAVLGDLLVPADLVLEEMQHWFSNLSLIETSSKDLMTALDFMEKADPKLDFDDYLLKQLCVENEVDLILTSIPKSREFYWPVLVFKPEKVRELTFAKAT